METNAVVLLQNINNGIEVGNFILAGLVGICLLILFNQRSMFILLAAAGLAALATAPARAGSTAGVTLNYYYKTSDPTAHCSDGVSVNVTFSGHYTMTYPQEWNGIRYPPNFIAPMSYNNGWNTGGTVTTNASGVTFNSSYSFGLNGASFANAGTFFVPAWDHVTIGDGVGSAYVVSALTGGVFVTRVDVPMSDEDYQALHTQASSVSINPTFSLCGVAQDAATDIKAAILQFANKTPLPLHVIFYPDGVNGSMTPATCDIPAAPDMYSQTTGSITYNDTGPIGLVNGHVQVYAGNQLVTDLDLPWQNITGGQGLTYLEQLGGGDFGQSLWNDAGIPAGNLTQNFGGSANNNLPFGTSPANSAVQGQLVNALQSSAVGSINGGSSGVLGNPSAPTTTGGPTTTTTIQNGQTSTVVSTTTGPMSSGILGPGDEALIHRAVASAIASNMPGGGGDGFLTNGTVSTAHGYAEYFTNGPTAGFGTNAQVSALTGQVAATQSALSGSMSNAPSFMAWLIPQWPQINNDPVWTCSAGDYSMDVLATR